MKKSLLVFSIIFVLILSACAPADTTDDSYAVHINDKIAEYKSYKAAEHKNDEVAETAFMPEYSGSFFSLLKWYANERSDAAFNYYQNTDTYRDEFNKSDMWYEINYFFDWGGHLSEHLDEASLGENELPIRYHIMYCVPGLFNGGRSVASIDFYGAIDKTAKTLDIRGIRCFHFEHSTGYEDDIELFEKSEIDEFIYDAFGFYKKR